ncbi:MAG: hypothetical protein ABI690_27785 [Chloroflexota bacterium]
MLDSLPLSKRQRELAGYWLPALAAGAVAWIVFLIFGRTPVIRALALAAPISVIALTLRRFGGLLAFTGGLALAFSSGFWSQTGGGDPTTLTTIVAVLIVAGIAGAVFIWFGKRPGLGLTIGLVIFTILFWALVGTNRSLRLTTFFSAGLIFVLMNALFNANPRPDESPQAPSRPRPYHTWGLLLFLALGVLNDPLFTLLAPATILGLILSRSNLKPWHWITIFVILVVGLRGIAVEYLNSTWWLYPAAQAEALGIRVPYMMADGWRDGTRWVVLISLVISQFTIIGMLLGVIGLARFARWYPPLGVVTMVAYAAYALFGLIYFGKDSAVLLLPLLMIQTIWMTYAVHTLSQWLQKSLQSSGTLVRWAAPGVFVLMPLVMFLRIAGAL